MFCRMCGRPIPADSRFCPYCGVAVQVMEASVIEQTLVLSPAEAAAGTEKQLSIDGAEKPVTLMVPARTGNGQVFRLARLRLTEESGKRVRKDVYIRIEIKDK